MLNIHEPISKDDENWQAILSGSSVPDADPNTIREARVLRMVLLARAEEETEVEFAKTDDQQWQCLKNQLVAEGYINEVSSISKFFKDFATIIIQTVKPVAEVLTWQKLSFAAAYTVLVSVVTLTLFLPSLPVQDGQPKSVGPNQDQGQGQTQLSPYRDISRLVPDPQQTVLGLQEEFTDNGTGKKDVAVFKNVSDPQQLIVVIQIAKNPPLPLREVYRNYQIDPEHHQQVRFFVRPE